MAATGCSTSGSSRPVLLRRPLPPVKDNKTQSSNWNNVKGNVLTEADRILSSLQGSERKNLQALEKSAEKFQNTKTVVKEPLLYQRPGRGHYPFPLRKAKKPKQIDSNAFLEDSYQPPPPSFTLKDFLKSEHDCHKVEVLGPGPGLDLDTVQSLGLNAFQTSPNDIDVYFDENEGKFTEDPPNQETIKATVLDIDDTALVPAVVRRRPFRQVLIEEKVRQLQREVTALEEEYKAALQNKKLYWPSVVRPTYLVEDDDSYSEEYYRINNDTPSGRLDRAILAANYNVLQDHKASDLQRIDAFINERVENDHALAREVLVVNSPPVYFQGSRSARSPSPFEFSEVQGIYPVELAVLNCIAHGGTKLNLKAHFLEALPDINKMVDTLTYANLSFNDFVTIPSELFNAKQLTILKMRTNPIHEIPRGIKKLKKLKTLVLSFCCVSSLPPSLFKLTRLEILDLSYNKLGFVPDEIKYLRHLRDLNVEGNQLSSFPRGILQLNIRFLKVANNFIHPLFWREIAIPQPLRLLEISATYFVSRGLHLQFDLDEKLASFIQRASVCDYCGGPKFGQGVRVVKPALELFGVKNLPILFNVCSQTCKKALKRSTEISPSLDS